MCSCSKNENIRTIKLDDVPLKKINIVNTVSLDSVNAFNVFSFERYIFAVVPQSSYGKKPYSVYDDKLKLITTTGEFGHSGEEFTDVNPLYVYKTDTSFFQCTDGFFESEFKFHNNKLTLMNKKRISSLNMNELCRLNDSVVVFQSENMEKEFVMYNTLKNEMIYSFSTYPEGEEAINDYGDFIEKEDRWNYYDKTIAYNKVEECIYSFYLNIPLVRIYDKDGNNIISFALNMEKSGRKEYIEKYAQEDNPIYFCMVRALRGNVFSLYHGVQYAAPYSEIQVWAKDGLKHRFYSNRWISCFDVDDSGKFIYGIFIENDTAYLFKSEIAMV